MHEQDHRPQTQLADEPPGKVVVLSDELANQIAAGEVVERPAAVVKELVENSLDAGATRIFVTIEDGGRQLIQVVDDGCGMSRGDARRALLRHATSKITSTEDLFRISTLGFRGEAIPSIASVSRTSIDTKERGALVGTRLVIEGGRVVELGDSAQPDGTRIEVRDLFFNTPARLKFLKTTPTEARHISESLLRLSISRPDVHLRLTHNDRRLFDLPPNSNLGDRILAVLGREVRDALYPTAQYPAIDGVRCTGFYSRPDFTQRAARHQYVYVNGRYIKERTVQAAIKAAYRGVSEKGRYPAVVLFIDMPPENVDVNVHPTKVEVRFRSTDAIFRAVYHAINDALQDTPWVDAQTRAYKLQADALRQHDPSLGARPDQATLDPDQLRDAPNPQGMLSLGEHRAPAEPPRMSIADLFGPGANTDAHQAPQGVNAHDRFEAGDDEHNAPGAAGHSAAPATANDLGHGALPAMPQRGRVVEIMDPEAEERARAFRVATEGYFSRLTFIGQYKRNYLLCGDASGLVIIDQHAAHERITYERLRAIYARHHKETQTLLFPQRVSLDTLRAAAMQEFCEFFEALGFEIEHFGGNDYALKAVPAILSKARHDKLIKDALDDLSAVGRSDRIAEALDAILVRMACHGSIRAGDDTNAAEARELFRQMDAIDFGANCPHGRPVYFRMPLTELEAAFGRH